MQIHKILFHFLFQPVEGMLSHQLEQNRIDGEKTIIQVFLASFLQKGLDVRIEDAAMLLKITNVSGP